MQRGEAGLLADLATLAIPFARHEHSAVFTVEESRAIDADIPGAHTKNLFLRDVGGSYWLVTVPAEARVDLKALPAAIGSRRVSFGRADAMEQLLGITPGSVTPLAMVNAVPGSVNVVIDRALAAAERVNVHPLRNTATLGLSGADLLDLLAHWGHAPLVADIPLQEPE